ncbi:metallophosphoesterase [Caenimonas aquaedulcis]|uniref:Metallophosphoesterase n=1 Tax=Caenimonas aquaedulcis TaxID=2793270 RepID=A0A931MHL8_9BURK|nr:metallophosphoesterase [Caenimonas aquaedulcis]MBG9389206.1 metallophosphoesterase [Caenimonas aquaedulcis]
MSIAFLFGLSAAFHFYVGARLVPALSGTLASTLLSLVLVASAVLMPLGLLAGRRRHGPIARTLGWLGLVLMGFFSSLWVLTVARDVLLLVLHLGGAAGADWPIERIGEVSAAAVPLVALFITAVGFANARRTAGVKTVEIPVADLPAAFHGFRIVQISDVHVGPTIRDRQVQGIVDAVNGLQADLVAITGDLVDGSVSDLTDHVAPLAQLASREGSFFVTGNHEYYSGVVPWLAELRRLGIRNLHNEHVVIERGGSRLVLAGVTDFTGGHFDESHRSDPHAALAGAPPDAAFKVLLAHQPRSAPAAASAGFDLQLSGHTHGGQFLPWNFLVRLQQPFTAGLHAVDELLVYVSRGTGYWGPPKRFGAPSEITLLKLVPTA